MDDQTLTILVVALETVAASVAFGAYAVRRTIDETAAQSRALRDRHRREEVEQAGRGQAGAVGVRAAPRSTGDQDGSLVGVDVEIINVGTHPIGSVVLHVETAGGHLWVDHAGLFPGEHLKELHQVPRRVSGEEEETRPERSEDLAVTVFFTDAQGVRWTRTPDALTQGAIQEHDRGR